MLRELAQLRQIPILVPRDGHKPTDKSGPAVHIKIIIDTRPVPLRRGVELSTDLTANQRTNSTIGVIPNRPVDPRAPKRATQIRLEREQLNRHPPSRVRHSRHNELPALWDNLERPIRERSEEHTSEL